MHLLRAFLVILSVAINFFTFGQTYFQSWAQDGLDIDGEAAGDLSGRVSLSSDGTIVAIGAQGNDNFFSTDIGHVRVFENVIGTWTQVGSDINGEARNDQSGQSVSLSSDGTTLAIGAPFNDGNGNDAGHVRVYKNISGTWTQLGSDIDGEAAGDLFGFSVSLSSNGTVVAIGARDNDGNGSFAGHVRIYSYSGGSWTQVGSDIDGEGANNRSGYAVSLSSNGSIVAIGAYGNNNTSGTFAGHVRIYSYSGGSWTQVGSDIDGEARDDQSGGSVSLSSDGTIVAIGAQGNDGNGANSGQTRVYKNISGTWTQVGSDIDGETAGDRSGSAVSLSSDGSIVAIGAIFNDATGSNAGHTRVFKNINGSWTQIGSDIDGEAAGDESGAVCLSANGNTVAIGASWNAGFASGAGHTRVYSICNSVAVYDTITACDSYTWTNGITYTESNNIAQDTFDYPAGCDSIVRLNLTILTSSSSIDTITACDSFLWTNGITYHESNTSAKDTFVNAAGCDSIVRLNLTILTSSSSIDTITACDSFLWTNGITYHESNTSAKDTFVNAAGCDSIVALNLTIYSTEIITNQASDQNIPPSQNGEFELGLSISSGLTFQWETDLGTGFQLLSDAGQYSGTQTKKLIVSNVTSTNHSQKFRCIIYNGDCSDTSDIVTLTINTTSVDNILSGQAIQVYPNPTNDLIHIQAKAQHIGTSYTIYSYTGEVVLSGQFLQEDTIVDLKDLSEGVYLISIGDDMKQTIKVVKK
jgi:Flp pilus assembly pilin Flp